MSVPVHRRVVEVISDLGVKTSQRYRYGSGFLVRGTTVLTAAHVVQGAPRIVIRGSRQGDARGGRESGTLR
jgi:V8-like Glu-specific endopeptidase